MDALKVGRAIQKLRHHAGYTQQELAEALYVTDKAVSKWERGLSIPDISIIAKLSEFLNVGIDNLLEGNVAHIEEPWCGVLYLKGKDTNTVRSNTVIYDKPMIHIMLSYFLLVGIRDIYIMCDSDEQERIKNIIGYGERIGIKVFYSENIKIAVCKNTMVVYDYWFMYGVNLTRYFQRAMSRSDGITVPVVQKKSGDVSLAVSYNHKKQIKLDDSVSNYYRVPILFCPHNYICEIREFDHLDYHSIENILYAEPIGNGMVDHCVRDIDDVLEIAEFIRFMQKINGGRIYDIYEIALKRKMIKNK